MFDEPFLDIKQQLRKMFEVCHFLADNTFSKTMTWYTGRVQINSDILIQIVDMSGFLIQPVIKH